MLPSQNPISSSPACPRSSTACPVAARLAGDSDLEGADAGEPCCYGRCAVAEEFRLIASHKKGDPKVSFFLP